MRLRDFGVHHNRFWKKRKAAAGQETLSGYAGGKKEPDTEIGFKKAKNTAIRTVWLSGRLGIPLRIKVC
jgi:hypothetical protein